MDPVCAPPHAGRSADTPDSGSLSAVCAVRITKTSYVVGGLLDRFFFTPSFVQDYVGDDGAALSVFHYQDGGSEWFVGFGYEGVIHHHGGNVMVALQ